ncbi:hypothetical protein ACS0TY_021435 [Phlomoides rotata]
MSLTAVLRVMDGDVDVRAKEPVQSEHISQGFELIEKALAPESRYTFTALRYEIGYTYARFSCLPRLMGEIYTCKELKEKLSDTKSQSLTPLFYNALIGVCARNDDLEKALNLMERMRQDGYKEGLWRRATPKGLNLKRNALELHGATGAYKTLALEIES